MNLLEALDDPKLFAPVFGAGSSWKAWRAFLKALFAYVMDDEERAIYRACTGRSTEPQEAFEEAWAIVGRRGGKSRVLAIVATFLANFFDYRPFLAAGEVGVIPVVAADRAQAKVILGYVKGLLNAIPMLKRRIKKTSRESIELNNGLVIEVHTGSYRTVRGYTVVAFLGDEVAFWRSDDSANPDTEILNAIRPATVTIPNAVILLASSPYARRGAMWEAHQKHFGKNGPVLVWKAATRVMNPSVPQKIIDAAYEDDPASASAEYGAEFRTDIESYIVREAVLACVQPGVRERPPERRWTYHGFVDPSGGSGADSMTLAISHKEGKTAILDALREVKPPFKPETVVEEFADLAKKYQLTKFTGDRWGGEWVREPLRRAGINFELAAQAKSDLYRETLPLINSGLVDLLDNDRLVNQLCQLERRTGRGGKDSIDHAPGAHDDIANAVAGALVKAMAGIARRPGMPQVRIESARDFNPHTGKMSYARH